MSCGVKQNIETAGDAGEDANRDNGMITKVWGPPGWLFLHCITFGYPFKIDPNNPEHVQKQKDYRDFFHLIGKVFPCRYCRDSYQNFIKDVPIEPRLGSRDDICKWLYDVHNKVNEKLEVPACNNPTFETVKKRYEEYRAKCKKTLAEEEIEKKVKGCVIPADGTRRKCVLNIITNKRMDGADFENYTLKRDDDAITFSIDRNTVFTSIVVLFIVIYLVLFWSDVKRIFS